LDEIRLSEYNNPLDLKVATDTFEKFGDARFTPIVSRSTRQSVTYNVREKSSKSKEIKKSY